MKTKNILLLAATVLSIGVVACGDDSAETTSTGTGGGSTGTDATASSSGTGNNTTSSSSGDSTSTGVGGEGGGTGGTGGEGGQGGSGPPAIPELGPQLERMGRPAVNTALNETFITLAGGTIGPTTDVIRSTSEDNYNEAVNGTDEAAAFVTTHTLQLTVLDGLDGVCGNQPLYGSGAVDEEGEPIDCTDLTTAPPGVCYGALATVLNADALWVKTEYTTCGVYLGIEADTAALVANDDCGGRRPIDDVIRTTYSVVAGAEVIDTEGGTPTEIFLFDDNITPPADLHPEAFPFLAAPYAE